MLKLLLVCVMSLSVTGLSAQTDKSMPGAYVIQANDLLSIFVFNHGELSTKVTVQPDGLISIPLVQSIPAAGITPAQLKVEIEKRLEDLIDVPNVTVIIEAIQSYRIFVIGKVQKPGILSFEKPLTVLQALAMAGGFQDYAKKSQIAIVRTSAAQGTIPQIEKKFSFNYEEVMKGTNPGQDIFLQSGDVVIIQ